MIEEEIIVRDELAGGDSTLDTVGCIFRWLRFEFADGTMTLRGNCGSGALAEESTRMTPAYEDGKGKMHSAAASSDSDSSIQA